jgi:hypothetical protein
VTQPPSYHSLHITTADIPRTSIFNLPYGLEVICNRVGGWCLWGTTEPGPGAKPQSRLIAGEYEGPKRWLVLDVDGHIIVDSRP